MPSRAPMSTPRTAPRPDLSAPLSSSSLASRRALSAPDQLHALLKAASVPPEVLTALLNALVAPACEAVVGADRAEDVLRTLLDPVRADALTRAAGLRVGHRMKLMNAVQRMLEMGESEVGPTRHTPDKRHSR